MVEDEKTEEVEDEMHFIEEDEIPFESEKETLQLEESVSKYSKGTDKIFDGRLEQLIGFEETTDEKELSVKETEEQPKEQQEESNEEPVKEILIQPEKNSKKAKQETIKNIKGLSEYDEIYASGKKLVAFVGAHQVGTSFLVNHLAEILQAKGVNTAILDLTKNRDSYYMYTKGDEDLRNIAINTKDNLLNDRNAGIKVRRNLFVYTSLPDEDIEEKNIKAVLQKLILKHDLVLIDCDLDTPINCFAYVNEVYLVQNMDVLAVQPLTEFLAELKEENVLNNKKFNIIINKAIFVRGLSTKMLISAMSCYSNPEMTETKELFDKNKIDRNIIPFDLKAYAKYLEAIAECDMNIIGYPKKFMKSLKEVAMKICPHVKFK